MCCEWRGGSQRPALRTPGVPAFYLDRASLETQTHFAQNQPKFHINKHPETLGGIHQKTLQNTLHHNGGGYNHYFGTFLGSSDPK